MPIPDAPPVDPILKDLIDSVTKTITEAYHAGLRRQLNVLSQAMRAQEIHLPLSPKPADVQHRKRASPGAIIGIAREFAKTANREVTLDEFAEANPDVRRSSRYMAFRSLVENGEVRKSLAGGYIYVGPANLPVQPGLV